MGIAILRCAAGDADLEVAGGVEMKGSPALGGTAGALIGKPSLDAPITESLDAIPGAEQAVSVHFSSPEATVEQVRWAVEHGAPVVVGTTGLDASQRAEIEKASKQIPVVFAPNMSVGVNMLFKLVGEVARILGADYDIEITEIHHRFKKDAPSGTARRLGEIAAEARGSDYDEMVVDGRSGITGERPTAQIGMHALRGGDVVGDHTVTFATLGERLELTHRAHSRDTLARGALLATKWVRDQKPGLYDMQDVLGLR